MLRWSIKTSLSSLKQLKQIGLGFQSDLLLKNLKTPNSSLIVKDEFGDENRKLDESSFLFSNLVNWQLVLISRKINFVYERPNNF